MDSINRQYSVSGDKNKTKKTSDRFSFFLSILQTWFYRRPGLGVGIQPRFKRPHLSKDALLLGRCKRVGTAACQKLPHWSPQPDLNPPHPIAGRLVLRCPSPRVLAEGAQGHWPRRGAPASRGRCGPLSRERPSQPGGCFSLSLSLSLSRSLLPASHPGLERGRRCQCRAGAQSMAAEGGGAAATRSPEPPKL